MRKYQQFVLFTILVCMGSFVDQSSAVGLNEVLDIIKLAKDVVVAIAKAWNIVDQHVDFSEIPIPLLDKTEAKLFGKIGVISAKLDKLGSRVDEVEKYIPNFPLNSNTLFTNEVLKNDGKTVHRKVSDRFKEFYRFVHEVIKYVVGLINETNYSIAGTSTIAMVLHTLPDRVRLELRLNDLLNYITRMDVNYRSFQNYVKDQNELERLTLEDFAKHVVSHDSNSINNLVERIHAFIAPSSRGITNTGLITLLLKSLEKKNFGRHVDLRRYLSCARITYNNACTIQLEAKDFDQIICKYLIHLCLTNVWQVTTSSGAGLRFECFCNRKFYFVLFTVQIASLFIFVLLFISKCNNF